MEKENQPKKVIKINCPNCGELLLKVYPWSPFVPPPKEALATFYCIKPDCQAKRDTLLTK